MDRLTPLGTPLKWTNVKDELPEIDTPVLVLSNGFQKIGFYYPENEDDKTTFIDDEHLWEVLTEVTHWMYLPDYPDDMEQEI